MGGSAFSSGDQPLNTPRMPKEVYEAVKSQCYQRLRSGYSCVASPIDGPEKANFGDIDILVALPKDPSPDTAKALERIGRILESTRVIIANGDVGTAHFALPWPSLTGVAGAEMDSDSSSLSGADKFVQVDVRICGSEQQLQWMLFKHGHGDFWNIMGSVARPFGFTVDDSALWLRIPEIERVHKSRSKIFLSSQPAEILPFFGLRGMEIWDQPFKNLDAMYAYVSESPLFHVEPLLSPDECAKFGNITSDFKFRNGTDARKRAKRPAVQRWTDEYLPRCREAGKFAELQTTREEMRQKAFDTFKVEEEYAQRRNEFLQEQQRQLIANDTIKNTVPRSPPEDNYQILYRSCLVKALKRIILESDERYGVYSTEGLKDERGFFVIENVVDWIVREQDEIGGKAMELHNEAFIKRCQEKAAKLAV